MNIDSTLKRLMEDLNFEHIDFIKEIDEITATIRILNGYAFCEYLCKEDYIIIIAFKDTDNVVSFSGWNNAPQHIEDGDREIRSNYNRIYDEFLVVLYNNESARFKAKLTV